MDSTLMVIDSAKGVEERTIKLMEVCRLRATPIMTFMNKLDREGRDPISLMDEVEEVLKIRCAPLTWPIGMGKSFRGVYHLVLDQVRLSASARNSATQEGEIIKGLNNAELDERLGSRRAQQLREEVELLREASHAFDVEAYRRGELTPVFFGSAINSLGIRELLDSFVEHAPPPQPRETTTRVVDSAEPALSGFVFKIQANMDPNHRDRIAFLRVCSGVYRKGMKLRHLRSNKELRIANAITFLASERGHAEEAYPGDILGLYNHGTIQVGDTLTEGEELKFTGIPNFAPELFRLARLQNPMRMKALQKGLAQLCEEGASQLFRPLTGNELVVGALGVLQFDVVAFRLKHEYGVECRFEPANVVTARWVSCEDPKRLEAFKERNRSHLAVDVSGDLAYLAPTRVNLELTAERWPEIRLHATREH